MDRFMRNAALQQTQPQTLRLRYDITGAKAVKELVPGGGALVSCDAITQAALDAFLGVDDDVDGDAFDATAMGNDVFGGVVNMLGDCAQVLQMKARCYSATNTLVTRQCQASATLTASTLATEVAATDAGNIAFRVDFGNTPDFDGLTDGTIEIDIEYMPSTSSTAA